ncbi:uncharacterized protein METZ01_LOCUS517547, partial [marine metagenome]
MEQKFVYTMKGLSKSFDSGQTVLNEIWLSFLLGAKIGVLGLNGAGKSTLLRVMAGQITAFQGEAFPADGISIDYLPQEPQLNPDKTVIGNVEEGVSHLRDLLTQYDEVIAALSSGLSDLEPVLNEQG